MSEKLWGSLKAPNQISERKFGKGTIYWGGELNNHDSVSLYPTYKHTAQLLSQINIGEDFSSVNQNIRYGHRKTVAKESYFVANRTAA